MAQPQACGVGIGRIALDEALLGGQTHCYIETSVISYFVGRPSKNLLTTSNQQITRRWWSEYLPVSSPFISIAVADEIRDGNPVMAAKRLAAVASFPLLPIGDTINKLIEALLRRQLVPAKSPTDAAHLAFAAAHNVDFLATWNFRHLANPFVLPRPGSQPLSGFRLSIT